MPPRRRHRGAKNGDSPGDSGDAVTPPGRRSKDRSAPLVSRGGQSRGQGRARASPADTEEGRRRLAQAEYDTEIHFQKCYGVMTEVFEAHQSFPALPEAFHFLDLGCAPGGFSTYLLNDARCAMGYGVTLSAESGGFPARIMKHAKANRYALQYGDLFRMEPKELAATSNIYFVIADAQYLNDGLAYAEAGRYTGARCSTKQNGIWALTLKQMWLGFDRLETGGSFMIRFGWKDYGDQWSVWYKACALRLFQLLYAVFGDGDGPPAAELFGGAGPDGASFSADLNAVRCCKSSYFNTSTSSFYIVASGFRRQAYLDLKVAELLRKEIETLTAKDSGDHDILDVVVVAEDVSTKVEEELAKIEKLREIGENTKKWTNSQGQVGRGLEVGAAGMRTVCVQPLLVQEAQLHDLLAAYGHVQSVWTDPMSNTGYVKFASIEEASSVVSAINAEAPAELQASNVYLRMASNGVDNEDPWENASWDPTGAALTRGLVQMKPTESVFEKPPPPPGFGAVDGDEGDRWRSKKLNAGAAEFLPSGQSNQYMDYGDYSGYVDPGYTNGDGYSYANGYGYDGYADQYDGFVPAGFQPTVTFHDPSTSEWVPLHEGDAAGDADFVPLNPDEFMPLNGADAQRGDERTSAPRRKRGGQGRRANGDARAEEKVPNGSRSRSGQPNGNAGQPAVRSGQPNGNSSHPAGRSGQPNGNSSHPAVGQGQFGARADGPTTVRATAKPELAQRRAQPEARKETPTPAPWAGKIELRPPDEVPAARPALSKTLAEHQNRTRELLASQQSPDTREDKKAGEGLHPALRAHQDKTRDLIAQLLKE